MQFLELAPELVHQILLEAVLTRGVQRSLTLRLVCKRFSQDVQFALFESYLLDDHSTSGSLSSWHINRDRRASTFWHSYLVYRVQYNSHSYPPHFRHIRRLVETICAETGDDVETTIKKLCWPILGRLADCVYSNLMILNFEADLLRAATYLNVIPVVKPLLQGGYPPRTGRDIFNSPMTLAAWVGNKDSLEYLQKMVFETQSISYLEDDPFSSIIGAATSGDIVMSTFDNTRFIDGPFVLEDSIAGRSLLRAQISTGDLEMYKHLGGFFPKPTNRPTAYHLMLHIRLGNLKIVKYILDTTGTFFGGAQSASGAKSQDMIDLLLEYGFDVQKSEWLGDKPISKEA
ncbi:putative ankyrin repeat protein [Botrytis fragariae]|uniref:Putative ankyrin repeat protein n=1 Tax=Botrytis fragariae TaxID=1964551 RepID=A0A8H6AND0_9HELO|nr:putative ankyrin repeat protein [Botrytis fragariae]KAF5870523.1 putative ankyrin repeat protein [Botrytis fragariae]